MTNEKTPSSPFDYPESPDAIDYRGTDQEVRKISIRHLPASALGIDYSAPPATPPVERAPEPPRTPIDYSGTPDAVAVHQIPPNIQQR